MFGDDMQGNETASSESEEEVSEGDIQQVKYSVLELLSNILKNLVFYNN